MGSGFDDWFYWHFFTITVDYNSSLIELLDDISLKNKSTNLGLTTRYLLLYDNYGSVFVCALWREDVSVCLLALVSAVLVGSESLWCRDHILLSQI
jgi:hypothetical protein